MGIKKFKTNESNEREGIFLYFPIFSLLFVALLAMAGVKGNYTIDEESRDIIFWEFFFVFLLLPLALQVVWAKSHYNVAQVLPVFSALGGYVLYYILGDWLGLVFFMAATLFGVWMNILLRKKTK